MTKISITSNLDLNPSNTTVVGFGSIFTADRFLEEFKSQHI